MTKAQRTLRSWPVALLAQTGFVVVAVVLTIILVIAFGTPLSPKHGTETPLQTSSAGPGLPQPDGEQTGGENLLDSSHLNLLTPAKEATNGVVVESDALAAKLAGVRDIGGGTKLGQVFDFETGKVLYQSNDTIPMIPASGLKLLSSLVFLELLDSSQQFETKTFLAKNNTLVLVGGGDPALKLTADDSWINPASLTNLADETVAALNSKSVDSIQLVFDDLLFAGPMWNDNWEKSDIKQIGRVSALAVDKATIDNAPCEDPAAETAALFAKLLTERGITVTQNPARVRTDQSAELLASVKSPTVMTLIKDANQRSDNYFIETLARHAAIKAGNEPSYAGAAATVKQTLEKLGVWQNEAVLTDTSGLAKSNRVSVSMLGETLKKAYQEPKFRMLLEVLPVAGANGTLKSRLDSPAAEPGQGWVHAKTGTLTGVRTLTGYTKTSSGRLVGFVFAVNNAENDWEATVWVDEMAGALTTCGCP